MKSEVMSWTLIIDGFMKKTYFPKEWFYGADEMAEMKLWLPIKKV